MIVLDKPYVSDLLLKTIANHQLPLITNQSMEWLDCPSNTNFIEPEQAIIELNSKEYPLLYSNSENAIHWIVTNLKHTHLPEKIELFKNKAKFRKLVSDLFPNFFYKEVSLEAIENLDISQIPMPFIIKPNVGFFSLDVYKVENSMQWLTVKKNIVHSIQNIHNLYPTEVVDTRTFVIEQFIEGEEFAIDAYFNSLGEAVIVGIFKHLFSSDADVSDRVYYTSKDLIEENLESFTNFLNEIGKRARLKNFPVHVEIRVPKDGTINPIEVNPMRFGGWCTTADLTTHAFGMNPYLYYCNQLKPNWIELLHEKQGKKYCMVLLDNSTGNTASQIESFNYAVLINSFEKVLDLRKTNWKEYPLFGILFTETREDNYQEIEKILKSNLREFITLK
ncbi:MAG: ATP-grasp domain-containing protein [Salinivirgaceae bacterium]|jgi:hypothetical protein